jgi:hypothetical protein
VFSDGAAKGDTHAYYVVRDAKKARVTSPYIPQGPQGELDTGSPDALKQAVAWAKSDYPSQLLWIDDNDHGAGWHGINQDAANNTYMKLPAYAQAIKDGNGGKPVDLLTHDACLMASAEASYELKDSAKVIVASEDETFPLGMHYDQTLADLSKNPTTDPVELAKRVMKNAQMTGGDQALDQSLTDGKAVYQISAIDTSKAPAVADSVDGLAKALLNVLGTQRDDVMKAVQGAKPFYVASHGGFDWGHRDLGDLVGQIKQNVKDPAVQAAADKVDAAVKDAVIQQAAVPEEGGITHGMSIYLPTNGEVDPDYEQTAFAKNTGWVKFLKALKTAN